MNDAFNYHQRATGRDTRERKWPRETNDRSTVSRFNPVNFQDRTIPYIRMLHLARNSTRNSRDSIGFTICNSNESATVSKKLTNVNDLRRVSIENVLYFKKKDYLELLGLIGEYQ